MTFNISSWSVLFFTIGFWLVSIPNGLVQFDPGLRFFHSPSIGSNQGEHLGHSRFDFSTRCSFHMSIEVT